MRAGTHHSRAEARAPATPLLTPGTRCRGGWGGGRGKGVRGEGGHPSHARPPGDGGANHPPPQPLTPPSLPCQLQQHRVCTLKHKCSNNRCKWSENCCPILPRASRHRARCRALPGGGCWVGPSLCCAAPPLACAALARRRPRMLCPFPLGFSPLHCTVDPCCICICACLPPLLMPLDWSQLPRGGREEGGGGTYVPAATAAHAQTSISPVDPNCSVLRPRTHRTIACTSEGCTFACGRARWRSHTD